MSFSFIVHLLSALSLHIYFLRLHFWGSVIIHCGVFEFDCHAVTGKGIVRGLPTFLFLKCSL